MDRRNFMGKSLFVGIACSCLNSFKVQGVTSINEHPTTPCNEKVEFTKTWVSRFFSVLDDQIDPEILNKVMRQNGKLCFTNGTGDIGEIESRSVEEIDSILTNINRESSSENNPRREGNSIYFSYTKNPKGLKVADGFCLCPMVEDGPAKLSPTFCQCSVGYVELLFKKITGRDVKVELLESLRSGGKQCSFKIEVSGI